MKYKYMKRPEGYEAAKARLREEAKTDKLAADLVGRLDAMEAESHKFAKAWAEEIMATGSPAVDGLLSLMEKRRK